MTECRRVRSKFTDYVDGELRTPDREAVDAHLSVCSACREEFAEHRYFLTTCDEFLVPDGPVYSFAGLRPRMADIEPLEEIVAFVPKVRIRGPVPRFAVSCLLMLLAGGLPATFRFGREMYHQARDPIIAYTDRVEEQYRAAWDTEHAAELDRAEREKAKDLRV
ncbi:MAG: zf-HC2 domain-containing protein [Candidatus Hydrogenedentes bacterium]|nr:zf-HC2 domain-containing protein [Candidatus Hydrogenedentota bacterium]